MILDAARQMRLEEQAALAEIDGVWDIEIKKGFRIREPHICGRLKGSRTPVTVSGYDSLDTIFRLLGEREYIHVNFMQIEDGFQMDIIDKHSKEHGYWSRDMKTAIYKALLVAEGKLPDDNEGELGEEHATN